MGDEQDSNRRLLPHHQHQVGLWEVSGHGTAANRDNSALLVVLVVVSWHVAEHRCAGLFVLALVSAFLDTVALMCTE